MKSSFSQALIAGLAVLAAQLGAFAASAFTSVNLNWTQLPSLHDPEGFSGSFAGVSGGCLLFAGGSNFVGKRPWEGGTKIWYDTVYVLNSPDGRWAVAGKLPRPNAYGVSATFHDEMICAGGGDRRDNFREVFALRWDGHRLRRRDLAPLPVPNAGCCGAIAHGILYIAGGVDRPDAGAAMRGFWALDLRKPNATWRTLPPIPGIGRELSNAAAIGDTFYLLSGVAIHAHGTEMPVRTYLTEAYSYTPALGWQQLADLPHSTAGAPSPVPVTPDGKLLIMSGDDGMRSALDGPDHPGFRRDGLLFDPATDGWSAVPWGRISRATAPVALWNGRWIIPGGERRPGYRSNEVWALGIGP